MEDILGLVVMIVFYIAAAASKKKKKTEKAKAKQRSFAQAFDTPKQEKKQPEQKSLQTTLQEAMERMEAARQLLDKAEKEKSIQPQGMQNGVPESAYEDAHINAEDEDCDSAAMHLHDIGQAQMDAAAEGEDPCHVGGKAAAEWESEDEDMTQREQAAKALLSGVIMSEILNRPSQRRAGYGRRA